MQVDILITTYKRLEDLMVLLKNLENQIFTNFSVQIFDGTPDDSIKIAIDEYQLNDRKLNYDITYLFTGSGMTRQRNIAVERTKGDLSIFLDDDVELENDYLEKVVSVFENDTVKEIAALNGFDTFGMTNKTRKLGKRKQIYRYIGLFPDIGPAQYLPWGHSTPHFSSLKSKNTDVDLLIGHNMAFRTKLLKEFKFDVFFEQYPTYVLYDDQDICLRLKKAGYRLLICYDAKLIHKTAPSGRPPARYYGFQAFYNAHRNWKIFGSQKPIHKFKFWLWEFLDIVFQLPSSKTRQMSIGRAKIFIKTFFSI